MEEGPEDELEGEDDEAQEGRADVEGGEEDQDDTPEELDGQEGAPLQYNLRDVSLRRRRENYDDIHLANDTTRVLIVACP